MASPANQTVHAHGNSLLSSGAPSAGVTSEKSGAALEVPQGTTAESIQFLLERILASAHFAHAEGLRRLLRYLVENTIHGRKDQLKEYVLGVEVFGRGSSFDPAGDAIVRVQAARLRAKLKEFYEREGQTDTVVFDIPKGSYVPVFRVRALTDSKAQEADREDAAKPHQTQHKPAGEHKPARQQDAGEERMTSNLILSPARVVLLFAVLLLLVGLGSLFVPSWTSKTASRTSAIGPSDRSIAVLPFVNLSSDRDQDFFCDGVVEEITNALAQVAGVRVIARTSAFQFKGKNVDVREIARHLNARTIVEGSVRKTAGRLRITAQLVNGADGYHLWSETYEREVSDVFAVQQEIGRAIANALAVRALPDNLPTESRYERR
jgi:TolB-like protein